MIKTQFKQYEKTLPDTPGVYFFVGGKPKANARSGNILYIGKATSLKQRVKSYFAPDLMERRGTRIVKMIEETKQIEFEKTDSALEAMILETALIKKHKPPYNAIGLDDKSYQYVVITDETFPRVVLLRANDFLQSEIGSYKLPYSIKKKFGPYPSGMSLREALKIIRKIFPFRDEKARQEHSERFYRSLGLSPDLQSKDAQKKYAQTIRHISLFFEGKKQTIVTELTRRMKSLAKEQKFEEAETVKKQIFALNHIRDISLIKKDFYEEYTRRHDGYRIEAYDVAHTSGADVVGVMTVLTDGEPDKSQYRKFIIKGGTGNNDVAALAEILTRRLDHTEWPIPKIVVIDGGKPQINKAREIFDTYGVQIPIISIVKDTYHRPKSFLGDIRYLENREDDIIFANAEAHRFAVTFHRKKRGKMM